MVALGAARRVATARCMVRETLGTLQKSLADCNASGNSCIASAADRSCRVCMLVHRVSLLLGCSALHAHLPQVQVGYLSSSYRHNCDAWRVWWKVSSLPATVSCAWCLTLDGEGRRQDVIVTCPPWQQACILPATLPCPSHACLGPYNPRHDTVTGT